MIESAKRKYEIGDIVKLRSGGNMTIEHFQGFSHEEDQFFYICVWITSDGNLGRDQFGEKLLELVK